MKTLDVPIFNEDGSIQFTATLTPEQAQSLLRFAYNFLIATGMRSNISVLTADQVNILPDKKDLN